MAAIGPRLGGELLGGSLYELEPGESTWPYHYELGCEEWLVVVSGQPTLRTSDGERQLEPGDVAVFPEGPSGAHKVVNGSGQTARVLILSSKAPLAVVHYPDSKKVGIWSREGGYQTMLPNEPALDYWEGE
ncbi:MAG TPA: cupin domain-containing protein [Gaiellaceae bacterium]|nr:cupin domain-containing protein [Gaiellaceae bacterium]